MDTAFYTCSHVGCIFNHLNPVSTKQEIYSSMEITVGLDLIENHTKTTCHCI